MKENEGGIENHLYKATFLLTHPKTNNVISCFLEFANKAAQVNKSAIPKETSALIALTMVRFQMI